MNVSVEAAIEGQQGLLLGAIGQAIYEIKIGHHAHAAQALSEATILAGTVVTLAGIRDAELELSELGTSGAEDAKAASLKLKAEEALERLVSGEMDEEIDAARKAEEPSIEDLFKTLGNEGGMV